MKKLLLLSLIISNVSLAGAFRSKNQLLTGDTTFRLKSACEAHYLEPCIDVRGKDIGPWSVIVPDTYLKEQVDACTDADDCQNKLEALTCTGEGFYPIKRLDILEVYCTKFVPEHIGIDQAVKTAYEAEKAASEALEAQVATAKKAIDCGRDVIAYMGVRNLAKQLTTAQTKTLIASLAEIQSLLEGGAMATARAEILGITADGTLITEADRSAIVDRLDACNPLSYN